MYENVLTKYLPVIRIVLKKSLTSDQTLALNAQDFVRAGLQRKSGYKFLLKFKDARLDNVIIDLPLASNLATVLLQDPVIRKLFTEHEFHISMNPKFEMTFKHIPSVETVDQ